MGSKGFGRASDRYGRIDVSKVDGTTYFVIDDDGEKYSAELTFRKTEDDTRIAHIVYSDGVEYEGYYYEWGRGSMESITPYPENKLTMTLCKIARSDWDYRGNLVPAFFGGWIYAVAFIVFWLPDSAHAITLRRKPSENPKEKERRVNRISGAVVMIIAMALMMLVTNKVPHGVHFFHI